MKASREAEVAATPHPVFNRLWPVYNGPIRDLPTVRRTLKSAGFETAVSDGAVCLVDAFRVDATRAGNTLLDAGFSGGICW